MSIDREDMVYEYKGIYSIIKKKKILPFGKTWMKPEGIILSEITQTEEDKYWYHLYVESEKTESMEAENRTVIARE